MENKHEKSKSKKEGAAMKKILMLLAVVALSIVTVSAVHAATAATQNASATIASVLSIEFANATDTTFGSGAIPWTSIDPGAGNLIYPTGHNVSKSDTAAICKYNGTGTNWYMKMGITGTLAGKIKYSLSQPVNSNTSANTNGTVAGGINTWQVVPATAATAYTSGSTDTINTPFGTFVGISYALDPTGLTAGTSYSGVITYTITTTP